MSYDLNKVHLIRKQIEDTNYPSNKYLADKLRRLEKKVKELEEEIKRRREGV